MVGCWGRFLFAGLLAGKGVSAADVSTYNATCVDETTTLLQTTVPRHKREATSSIGNSMVDNYPKECGCVLTLSGEITCIGNDGCEPAVPLVGPFSSLQGKQSGHCAIRALDHKAVCFVSKLLSVAWVNHKPMGNMPDIEWSYLAPNDYFSCGIARTSKNAVCFTGSTTGRSWGMADGPNFSPREIVGPFKKVETSANAACALKELDDTLECWTDAGQEFLTGMPTYSVKDVMSSGYDMWVLKQDGTLLCFGPRCVSASTIPPGPFVSFAVGVYDNGVGCAVRLSDNKPECFGPIDSPPDVAVSSLYIGQKWACGLRISNQETVCWGDNHDGVTQFMEGQHILTTGTTPASSQDDSADDQVDSVANFVDVEMTQDLYNAGQLPINDYAGSDSPSKVTWDSPSGITVVAVWCAWGLSRAAWDTVMPGMNWNQPWTVQQHFEWQSNPLQRDKWYWQFNCATVKQGCGDPVNRHVEIMFSGGPTDRALEDTSAIQWSTASSESLKKETPMYWELYRTGGSQRVHFKLCLADGTVLYEGRTTEDITFEDDHAFPFVNYLNDASGIKWTATKVSSSQASQLNGASAAGDPHLVNLRGEKFDLNVEGDHLLIQIPKGSGEELEVIGSVEHFPSQTLESRCDQFLFKKFTVRGNYVDARNGEIVIDAGKSLELVGFAATHQHSGKTRLMSYESLLNRSTPVVAGKVQMWGCSDHNSKEQRSLCKQLGSLAGAGHRQLKVFTRKASTFVMKLPGSVSLPLHLAFSRFEGASPAYLNLGLHGITSPEEVGGLLGSDDHSEVSKPIAACNVTHHSKHRGYAHHLSEVHLNNAKTKREHQDASRLNRLKY